MTTDERYKDPGSIEILCRDAPGQPFRSISVVGDRLRIGRRWENDLILSHASVSRYHAEIVRENGTWRVVDCTSKYGTSLNGDQVTTAPLSPGDEIRIGADDGPLLVFAPVARAKRSIAESTGEPSRSSSGDDLFSGFRTPSGAALWLVERFRATSLIGDFGEALALVADAALELTHFDRAVLFVANREELGTGAMHAEVARSRSGHTHAADAPREADFVGAAIASGTSVVVSPETKPDDSAAGLHALAREAGLQRAVCVPLRALSAATLTATGEARRITVGALLVEGAAGAAPIADGALEVLESLASEAGIVVERLYERQVNAARIRSKQTAQAATVALRAADASLSLAERARAASEHARYLLATGDTEEATTALERYADPGVRAQLPDALRAEVLDTFGVVFMWEARWHRAVGVLNAALALVADGQNAVLEMTIRTRLAICYAEIGESGIAREYALVALSFFRRLDEASSEHARALLALGMLEQRDGDLTSAGHAYRLAARIAEQADDLITRAVAHFQLATANYERGEVDEAIASLQRMLDVAMLLGNARLIAAGQHLLAECLVRNGAWRRADAVIAAGLETAEAVGSVVERARLLLLAARIAVRRDGGAAAERAVDRAREAAVQLEERQLEAEASMLEAEMRTADGDLDGARSALASVSAVARELAAEGLQSRVHLAIAEIARRERTFDSAESHVARAQHAANGARNLAVAGAAQHALGRINADRGRFTEAQHNFAQSLSIFRTLGDRPQIAAVHLDLGSLMLAANDPAYARTHLQLARDIFVDLGCEAAIASADAGLVAALAAIGPEAPLSYSSIVLGATSESRFVRRIIEAAQSRELLLRELTSIAVDLSRATWAAALSCDADGTVESVNQSGEGTAREVPAAYVVRAARGEIVRAPEMTLFPIEPFPATGGAHTATVLVVSASLGADSRADAALRPAVQLARQGLELVALRATLKRADLPDPGALYGASDQPRDTGAMAAGLVFASPEMRRIVEQLRRIRTSQATVLITGESGVGKDVVAHAIHAASSRPRAPFVPFNCSATSRELLESQLFGHKRGAFTGATADNPGVARAARGGTLFLDEVGDLPLEIQPKLLRFLESGEIQPLGETTPQRVDVRVIAATNTDLEQKVEERRFREDLFHRLNIIRLHVPPLRERTEDIPLLVAHFLSRSAEKAGRQRPPAISEEALAALVAFPWPGNVRQVRNEMERLVTFTPEGSTITRDSLSEDIRTWAAPPAVDSRQPFDDEALALADRLRLFEIEQLRRALEEADNNLTRAAMSLGMARQNLQRRLKKLGLRNPEG